MGATTLTPNSSIVESGYTREISEVSLAVNSLKSQVGKQASNMIKAGMTQSSIVVADQSLEELQGVKNTVLERNSDPEVRALAHQDAQVSAQPQSSVVPSSAQMFAAKKQDAPANAFGLGQRFADEVKAEIAATEAPTTAPSLSR